MEYRLRHRYLDLIYSPDVLDRARKRILILRTIRRHLDEQGYCEVETPVLHAIAGGAAARPFVTHHNALDLDLYLRIAPELYLKRLVVGGFEKVYELNRNFRNEGISTKHNPEFTMLEFYMAYADVNQMMDFAEKLLRSVVYVALGHTHVRYGEHEIDFSQPFQRMTMKEAIATYWEKLGDRRFDESWLADPQSSLDVINFLGIRSMRLQELKEKGLSSEIPIRISAINERAWDEVRRAAIKDQPTLSTDALAANIEMIFADVAEPHLIQPTFITDFPKAISPLSKASPSDPSVAERFEYFVGGLESANGFSELNDPEEQYQRFNEQVQQRERGDEEAMVMDEDYIRALSYGMPPAAGIGIGIDRLVMLLANKQSIRDVIMFPHMRPERLHQFSWLKWIYDEQSSVPDWDDLTELQQAGRLVERFRLWAEDPDSPPNRKRLLGDSEDDRLRTAQRALRFFRGE